MLLTSAICMTHLPMAYAVLFDGRTGDDCLQQHAACAGRRSEVDAAAAEVVPLIKDAARPQRQHPKGLQPHGTPVWLSLCCCGRSGVMSESLAGNSSCMLCCLLTAVSCVAPPSPCCRDLHRQGPEQRAAGLLAAANQVVLHLRLRLYIYLLGALAWLLKQGARCRVPLAAGEAQVQRWLPAGRPRRCLHNNAQSESQHSNVVAVPGSHVPIRIAFWRRQFVGDVRQQDRTCRVKRQEAPGTSSGRSSLTSVSHRPSRLLQQRTTHNMWPTAMACRRHCTQHTAAAQPAAHFITSFCHTPHPMPKAPLRQGHLNGVIQRPSSAPQAPPELLAALGPCPRPWALLGWSPPPPCCSQTTGRHGRQRAPQQACSCKT